MAASFSAGSNIILTVTDRGKATLWNVNGTIQKEWKVQRDTGTTTAAAISTDGTRMVTGTSDGTISIWNNNGALLKEWKKGPNEYEITGVALSRDGNRMLIGDTQKGGHHEIDHLCIYTIDGVLLSTISDGPVAAFSLDGKKIITSFRRYQNGINEYTADGKFLWNYKIDNVVVQTFSVDGSKIISGSNDGSIRFWESAMTLDEFLYSDRIEPLSEKQKRAFMIK